jgi:hypothetical protein
MTILRLPVQRSNALARGAVLGLSLLGFAVGNCLRADAQFKREDFQHANEATVRLKPGDFLGLPANVRAILEQRGCTIPQPYNARGRQGNVIHGRFTSPDQTDWAVLSSREKRSAVLVFYGGRSDRMEQIGDEPDLQDLQVVSAGRQIGYSRQIGVATARVIRRSTHSAQNLRNLDHDGIEDAFLEKGSVLWYYSNGKWVKLPGAD